jgi:hypothetical protein
VERNLSIPFPSLPRQGSATLTTIDVASTSVPTGILQNQAPVADFYVCYFVPYADFTTTSIVKDCCSRFTSLLVAGFATSTSSTFLLGAYAASASICLDTVTNSPNGINGVFWYLTSSKSFGFADSATIVQSTADTQAGTMRLSWHLDQMDGGYRVGSTVGLNSNTVYYKAIYGYDSKPSRSPTLGPTFLPTYSMSPTVSPIETFVYSFGGSDDFFCSQCSSYRLSFGQPNNDPDARTNCISNSRSFC